MSATDKLKKALEKILKKGPDKVTKAVEALIPKSIN